jgi:2-dehydro-3-deoxy-D-arabinonate dehydratase
MSGTSHERVCRFHRRGGEGSACVGAVIEAGVVDMSAAGVASLAAVLDATDPAGMVRAARASAGAPLPLADVVLLPPVERQEVWAAGVTYLRSKTARMEESDFSATAYDRVYDAVRPEIFFKAVGEKAVGPGDAVGIRSDARWSVPEPELALVMNSRGRLVSGCAALAWGSMTSIERSSSSSLLATRKKIISRNTMSIIGVISRPPANRPLLIVTLMGGPSPPARPPAARG